MAVHDPDFLRRAAEARSRISELSPAEVEALRDQGAPLLDLRSAADFAAGHIEGAALVAFDRLAEEISARVPDRNTPVICYCNAGNRSALAADALQQLGYRRATSIAGGLTAYREAQASRSPEP